MELVRTQGVPMKVAIKKLHPNAILPKYSHGWTEDAGMDLYAVEDTVLHANGPTIVKTGIAIELPATFEAQIRSRSGLALKGVTVANSPGTIDPSYRGEIGVVLKYTPVHAFGPIEFHISAGDRIAQMVIARYVPVSWDVVERLGESERGEGGFGSTGLKAA